MKVEFTIIGDCVSMKNSRQILQAGRGPNARPLMAKSKDARDFEAAIIRQIPKAAKLNLACMLRADVRVYYSHWRKDVDVELLFDALQSKYCRVPGKMIRVGDGEYTRGKPQKIIERVGVYENDRQIRIKNIDGSTIDKANPRIELCFETIGEVQASIPGAELSTEEEEDDDAE